MHPFIAPTTGASSGSFVIPTTGHTATNVWYRIYLTVTDSGGLTHTTQRDILPRMVRLTLATNPAGLAGEAGRPAVPTPLSFDSVVGIVRNIEAMTPQASGGATYRVRVVVGRRRRPPRRLHARGEHHLHRDLPREHGRHRSTACRPPTSTTPTSPAPPSRASIRRWTSRGARARRRRRSAPTPSACAGPGRSRRPFTGTYTFYTVSDDGVRCG